MHVGLERNTLGLVAVCRLDGLDIDKVATKLFKEELESLVLAVVRSSTDHVTSHAVHSALADADVADFGKLAATFEERLDHWDIAGTCGLNDPWCLAVLLRD